MRQVLLSDQKGWKAVAEPEKLNVVPLPHVHAVLVRFVFMLEGLFLLIAFCAARSSSNVLGAEVDTRRMRIG